MTNSAAEQIWERNFGPLLTLVEVTRALGGISEDALNNLVNAGKILELADDAGQIRYPAWQIDPVEHAVFPLVVQIIQRFRDRDADSWEIASFCVDKNPDLEGQSPRDSFGKPVNEAVLTAAGRAVSRLYD